MITYTHASGVTEDALTIQDVYGIIEKVAKVTLDNVQSVNPLAELDKGVVVNGTMIEKTLQLLAESFAYNKDAVDVFAKKNNNTITYYHDVWNRRQFQETAEDFEIRKILRSGDVDRLNDFIAVKIASLTEGANHEDFLAYKKMFKAVAEDATNPLVECGDIDDTSTMKDVLIAITNAVKSFTFVNDTYVQAGVATRTPLENIRIAIPYSLINRIDITTLANIFNLEKASMLARIIEIDTEDDIIYIFDKNAFGSYISVNEFTQQYNPKGLYMNYFLTQDKMFYFCPFFKATYLDCSELEDEPNVA